MQRRWGCSGVRPPLSLHADTWVRGPCHGDSQCWGLGLGEISGEHKLWACFFESNSDLLCLQCVNHPAARSEAQSHHK